MLKQLADNDIHQLWYQPQSIDTGKPTFLVVKLVSTDDWGDQPEFKYHIEVMAVGPKWPSDESLQNHLDSYGLTIDEFRDYPPEGQIELLAELSLAAHLWQRTGNNKQTLLKAARDELNKMNTLLGFYMDKPQNAIGDTGWDWIKGELAVAFNR